MASPLGRQRVQLRPADHESRKQGSFQGPRDLLKAEGRWPGSGALPLPHSEVRRSAGMPRATERSKCVSRWNSGARERVVGSDEQQPGTGAAGREGTHADPE